MASPSNPTLSNSASKRAAAVKKSMPSDRWSHIPNIRPQDLGLKICHEPKEFDETEIDVVAVHGIGVDPKTTWTHSETQKNWLSEGSMLPADLPNARIMTFGYDSVWFGERAVRQSLDSVAGKLLKSLVSKRKHCSRRPIILIGHCFGGLVIQQAYNNASIHVRDAPDIAKSITGMVFLGTPHHGISGNSGLTTQGAAYSAIVQARIQVQDNALQTMAQENDVLVYAVHTFTRAVNNRQLWPKLFCFYEQKATKIGKIVGVEMDPEIVVNESSGTLSGHDKEALPLDHFHMNKFEDKEDNNYQCVRDQIVNMAQVSIDFMGDAVTEIALSRSKTRRDIPSLAAPIAKETNFAPRGGVLETLESKFRQKPRVALCGSSGSGKTHIAVEYAHNFYKEHPGSSVYWVNANSAEQFQLSYGRFAEHLRLREEIQHNQSVLEAVCRCLNKDSSGYWLMVLDGLEDDDQLVATDPVNSGKSLLDFVPTGFYGEILITTRSKGVAQRQVRQKAEYVIEVDPLGPDDAALLLLGKVPQNPNKIKWIDDVSKTLEGSAGALTLVYNYCREMGKEFSHKKYLEELRLDSNANNMKPGAARAWQLLYELLKSKAPDAVHLMLLICSLGVQCVPNSFLDRRQVSGDIRILQAYGIVEPSPDRRLFYVTAKFRRLAQEWLAQHEDKKRTVEESALSATCDRFSAKSGDETGQAALLPCALAVLKFEPTSSEGKRDMANLLFGVSQHYVRLRLYSKAQECLEKCVSLREAAPESDKNKALVEETKRAIEKVKDLIQQPGTDTSLSNISPKDEAEGQLQKLLETGDAKWQNSDTARTASQLAALQMVQRKQDSPSNPVSLCQRVLDWSKDTHGANHIETARHQWNLSLAQESEGRYDEAVKLCRSAEKKVKAQIDPKKPDFGIQALHLKMLSSLAGMHCSQGQLDDADKVYRDVVSGQSKLLGLSHPHTLLTRHGRALLLQDRGQVDAARDELQEVLIAQFRLLGADDPATLQTGCNMALNLRMRGELKAAEGLYKQVLKAQTKVLGKTHVHTVTTGRMLSELTQETRHKTKQ